MLYVKGKDIENIPMNWEELLEVIEETTRTLDMKDFSQPIKPYVDFKNPIDRIIAMPAYVGGNVDVAGIKWIASFPDNINHGIPRANSVTILNDAHTGVPFAFFNTTLLSIIRTSAVSGVVLRKYLTNKEKVKVGICGFGPIGQMHYRMLTEYFKDQIAEIKVYDLKEITYDFDSNVTTTIVSSWEEAYNDVDVMFTTTVAKERYIDLQPKEGSLLMNVSLRDYKLDIYEYVKKGIIVDDWEEVCRKNTDIEKMYEQKGLVKEDTYTIMDVMEDKVFDKISTYAYMFNPMGMSSYDIAIGSYYYKKVKEQNLGLELE